MNVSLPPRFGDASRRDPALKQYMTSATDMRGLITKPYDVGLAWERARSKGDPLLAPHGMFRSLAPGDNWHAKEFLETFGPW